MNKSQHQSKFQKWLFTCHLNMQRSNLNFKSPFPSFSIPDRKLNNHRMRETMFAFFFNHTQQILTGVRVLRCARVVDEKIGFFREKINGLGFGRVSRYPSTGCSDVILLMRDYFLKKCNWLLCMFEWILEEADHRSICYYYMQQQKKNRSTSRLCSSYFRRICDGKWPDNNRLIIA